VVELEPGRAFELFTGWEAYHDPRAVHDEYGRGWPGVLELYREAAMASESKSEDEVGDAYTWVALQHRPGPAAPSDGNLFEAPGLGQHVECLGRMREAAFLVAAGPLLMTE
jgi:hypothetical protein